MGVGLRGRLVAMVPVCLIAASCGTGPVETHSHGLASHGRESGTSVSVPSQRPARSRVSGLSLQRGQQSGASGSGAANGSFGTWRARPLQIGGTWDDTLKAQNSMWTVREGGEWGDWQGDLDLAMGAIYRAHGQTWRAAAAGEYDQQWRQALQSLKQAWGSRQGTLFLRFAHEFNGRWTPWAVKGSEAADFVTAWRRFRALQMEVLPAAQLVFCPNDVTSAGLHLDWRAAFPGADQVDLMAVDSYNQDPFVHTRPGWARKIMRTDSYGAPAGIEMHRRFAGDVGLPMAVSEWGVNADQGDGALYVRLFAQWLADNAGWGPGQVPYEVVFNIWDFAKGRFALYPRTRMPVAAKAYRKYF